MRFTSGKSRPGSSASSDATTSPQGSRRRFLFTLGAGSASAAALTAVPAAAAVTTATPEPNAESSGYRETEHVRNYYRTAKL